MSGSEDIGLLEDFGDAAMGLAQAAIADALDDFYTAAVGRIVSVSADGKFASVQAYPKIWQTDENGNRVGVLMAAIPHARVLWPGGQGAPVLQWDLHAGDEVLIVWTKFDSSTTIATGATMDPDTVAQNHPSFAVCLPVSWRAGASPTITLARQTDPVQITEGTTVTAGVPTTAPLQIALDARYQIVNPLTTLSHVDGTITTGTSVVRSA